MPSPQTLDIEALLAPISGENPAGKSVRDGPYGSAKELEGNLAKPLLTVLRDVGPFDAIKEARRATDELAKGEWEGETKTADWRAVIDISTHVLSTKSKDIEIAAWMVEALVKRHGFPGLRDGLRLLREIQERFWESLYPSIEDGDLESRAGRLEWVNEKLPSSVRAVVVTQSRDGENYSWLHWEESRTIENLGRQNPEARAAALAEGKISGEVFDKAVAATPRAYFETVFEDLNECWEECERLSTVVDEKFGRDAPSLLNVKKALEDLRTLVTPIVKKKRELEPDPTTGQPAGELDQQAADIAFTPSGPVPFAPQNRADALNRLAAVADFFRRTEPHSPVAYLVQRAVQWGKMPLEEWLRDVIRDDGVLGRVRETLGLKDQDSGKSEESGGTSG